MSYYQLEVDLRNYQSSPEVAPVDGTYMHMLPLEEQSGLLPKVYSPVAAPYVTIAGNQPQLTHMQLMITYMLF